MTTLTKTCRICLQGLNEYPMGEKNGYRLYACKACGSVMTDPWPTDSEIEQFYADIQPEIVHATNPQGQIAAMKKLIQKATGNIAGRRFLDISSRQGYAVMAAKELGFKNPKGIDSHEFFTAFSKNRYPAGHFEHATVAEYAQRGEQAEFVFSIESLCEQTDPEAFMAALSKVVAPKGTLFLQEPNGNSMLLPRNFASWQFVDPPLNFAYLSEKGLKALLARHGFRVKASLFTWGPLMRLVAVKK